MPPQSATSEFDAILAAAHEFADVSGPTILKHFRSHHAVENKAGPGGFDPVTVADRAAEREIAKALKARFPDHGIVGEEYGVREGAAPYRWIVDPIDGTRSFITGSPMWGTLIGVLKGDEPYLGLIDHPFTGERLWSEQAATFAKTRDGPPRRLNTRPCATLSEAVFTSTHPDLFVGGQQAALAALNRQVRMTRYGGDCYAYGLLAAGYIDLIVEPGLKTYDIVAVIPVIERAGGVVTTWDGKPAANGGDIIAAGDPRVHEAALKAMAQTI